MAIASRLMGCGLPAAAALQIVGDVSSPLTATGTNQATALQISNGVGYVTTTPSGTGVMLFQDANTGDSQTIYNYGTNALNVYPPVGETIQGLAANAALSLTSSSKCTFEKVSSTTWIADTTFVPSGTGAITTETVQAALRRLVFAGQYDSTAHFNSARAALTGTMGVPPEMQFANFDPTKTTPSGMVFGGATFNGDYDPVLYFGYNISGATGDTKVLSSEPALKFGLEGHYNNGAAHLMEWNWDYTSSDGLTTRRIGSFTVDRTTHVCDWDFAGPVLSVWKTSVGTGASFEIDLTNGDNTTRFGLKIQGASSEIAAIGAITAGAITTVDYGYGAIGLSGGSLSTTSSTASIKIGGTAVATVISSGMTVASTITGGTPILTTSNTSNAAANADAKHLIKVGGSSGGDPSTEFNITGVTGTLIGLDNSDGFAFKISVDSSALGTNDRFVCDLNGHIGLSIDRSTTTWVNLPAGTTASSTLRIPHGSAPTSPVNGDIWTTTSGLFVRINGVTVGPLT